MLTRRHFIEKASRATGLGYIALSSLNFIPKAEAKPFNPQGIGNGEHIIILGGGLAGMAAGWELKKLGYKVTILEARKRTGGRVWTVRGGSQEKEINGANQSCSFDEGLYMNAGAARIPHHHELTLHYCKELNVPLEIYNNINEGAYFYNDQSDKRIRIRQLHNDMRGYISELLYKSIHQDLLDLPFSTEDKDKFLEYLLVEGDLDTDKIYKGTSRSGYSVYPGAGARKGKENNPNELLDLIQSGFLDPSFSNLPEYDLNLQQTLFQPVGGMDKISDALENQIKADLTLGAEVKEILNTDNGVKVRFSSQSQEKEITADYCICTLPLPVLGKTKNNFSQTVSRAIDFISYNKTGKIGLQFKRRFWEEDDQIYGGISRTNMDITQIFYPNCDYQSEKGVLVGYYNFGDKAERFADFDLYDREKEALSQGSKIHPQYPDEFENSFSLAWHKIPFSEGGWAQYNENTRNRFYSELIKPDGNVYFAGEHTTYLTAWMAGAFESARRSVDMIHSRINNQQPSYDTRNN